MIDLLWTDLTFELSLLFNISYVLFFLLFYKKCVINQTGNSRLSFFLLFYALLLVILVSAGSNSDWYSYQDMVWNYDLHVGASNYGEPFYGYLINAVNQNYLLFRLCVWGGAFVLSCFTFKRFGVNVNSATFFLISVYLIRFNYARASLAFSSYFLGLSFLLRPIKGQRILSFVLTVLFFWGAYEFHYSLLPVILLSVMAFLPLDKPFVVIILLLSLPLLASIINNNLDFFDSDYIASKLETYEERDDGRANFLGIIAKILMYGAFVIPILISSRVMTKHNRLIDLPIKRLFRVMIGIFIFALTFLFMGYKTEVFFYRYLFMTMIPLAVICVYLYRGKMMSKTMFTVILGWGIMSTVQPLLTGLYHTL